MGAVIIGADIGQKVDPTAIAVCEVERRASYGRREEYYLVRFLERLPLGTPYPQVAARVEAVVANARRCAADAGGGTAPARPSVTLYCDATGVGMPVIDLLRHTRVPVRPVFFNHGDRRTEQQDGTISMGKAWLVSRLHALLQTGRILLPRTAEAQTLATELLDYEITVDEKGTDTYGAFKVGTQDDLVTALGLATQPPKEAGLLLTGMPTTPLPVTQRRPRRGERDPLAMLRGPGTSC